MKDNKLYKVLRIIFLTLAILSMVFSLSKKFVHAEGSGTNQIPAPYGFGSGYGYRDWTGSNPIPVILDYMEEHNIDIYGILMYEQASDNSYLDFYICKEDFIFVGSGENGTTWNQYYGLDLRDLGLSGVSADLYRIDTNGNITLRNTNYDLAPTCSFPDGGVISSGVAYLFYPLWYRDNGAIQLRSSFNNPTYYDGFVFAGDTSGGGDYPGFGTGTIIGSVTDYDGRGFDYDLDISIDLNPLQVLGEEIRDGIGTLMDRVVEGFQTIGGKIDTFKDRVAEGFQTLTSIPSKVSDIYGYITEPFDEEKFNEKFEEMELGQELTTFRTDIESFTGTFNVSPAVAEDVRFSIPFTLPYVNQQLTATIDFSFYDRIRSIVVPFFTVFLIFGMVWSLIRSIPGILHGTSPDGDS